MPSIKPDLYLLFAFLLIMSSTNIAFAQEENVEAAEKLMVFQLEALKAKDHRSFVKHANEAFRKMMNEHIFDFLVMQKHYKIIKGYKLEYLGNIRNIAFLEYLWKMHITGDTSQLLGRLSLSHGGEVIGFSLE